MTKELEPTEEGYITRLINENTQQPELGEVQKVFEHTSDDDNSNFEANVELRDTEKTRREVPIATGPFLGAVAVPEPGDTVLVDFLDGAGESPVVVGTIHNIKDRAPLGQAGIYRLRKGSLYYEMHPDGDWTRMAKKPGDKDSPSAYVEVDDSVDSGPVVESAAGSGAATIDDTPTDGTVVTVEAGGGSVQIDDTGSKTTVNIEGDSLNINVVDGDITIEASGTINLGGTSGDPVARQGDPIEDGSGNQIGTISNGSADVQSS